MVWPGARFTKQTYNNFYPEFLVKIRLHEQQESYNNCNIKLKISFVNQAPSVQVKRRLGPPRLSWRCAVNLTVYIDER